MKRLLRLSGHPRHPALVHFPIALWTAGCCAEVAGWILHREIWWQTSFGAQASGVAMAIIAMVAGIVDYSGLPREHAAQDTAVNHMMAMGAAWLLFIVSLALRGFPTADPPSVWASIAAFAGLVTTFIGGWFGGTLVYRFGVGVKD
jgi:uncharacterized membrane protein